MNAPSKYHAAINACLDLPVMVQGSRIIRREGWHQIVNPLLNSIVNNRVDLSQMHEAEVEQRVEETFATYRNHQLPFKWSAGPMSSPARLEEIIAPRAEFCRETFGMAIDVDAEIPESPEDIRIERVEPENFPEFLKVNIEGWDLGNIGAQIRNMFLRGLAHPQYQNFLARRNGEAIGAASTILKDGYAYLLGAVVLEKFRGCGGYRALTRARLTELKQLNCPFAVTQAIATTSAPILAKLGFQKLFESRVYVFKAAGA